MKRLLMMVAASGLVYGGVAAADDYTIDAAHTGAVFHINHLGVSHTHGRFNDISGTLSIDEKDPTKNQIKVVIKADSIDTNNKKRDDHLRSPDFFNAKQFPTLEFTSKSWKKTGDKTFDVTGTFTLHGVSKEITVPVTKIGEGKDPWGGYRIGYDAKFTIKRGDYGINFMPDGLGAEVPITVSIEAIKKK